MLITISLMCLCAALLSLVLFLALRRNPLQATVDTARADIAVAAERLRGAEAERSVLAQELAGLRSREQALATDATHLRTTLTYSESRTKTLETDASDLQARHKSLEERFNTVTADLRIANARLETLQGAHSAALQDIELLRTRNTELEAQRLSLTGENQALATRRDDLQTQLVEQKLWLQEQTQHFEQRVLAAATKMMEERGQAFSELNRKEVDAVVAPFKAQLEEFRLRVDHIYDAENKERGELKQQILHLTSLNQSVSEDARRLTNALTISSKSTGDWGETILAKILEDSGLREDKEYRLQHSIQSQDGERLQPDAVIFLPGDRQLVVDSKVSNKAWTEYCAAEDEEQRQERLKDHLLSLRTHMKGLSGKDYARSPDLSSVDFVLMFVPVEGALLTALAADEALYTEAFQRKVILVTPSTLMAVVKLAEGLWTLQTRKESADQIAEAGRKLYEKLTNFADSFVDVGRAIDQSQKAWEKAKGQLSEGRGNAISLAQKMVELGVSPAAGKVIPAALLSSVADE